MALNEIRSRFEQITDSLEVPPKEPIILWQEPGRTVFVENSWGPFIPYPAVDHGDGTRNNGYAPMKGNLAEIRNIPEVKGWPAFQELLETINHESTPIESLGCEIGLFQPEEGGPQYPHVGCYVDLAFTDAASNAAPENHVNLAAHLIEAVAGRHDWWANVELGLQRLRGLPGVEHPWGLMVRVNNYGRTSAEAEKLFAETINLLCIAIKSL